MKINIFKMFLTILRVYVSTRRLNGPVYVSTSDPENQRRLDQSSTHQSRCEPFIHTSEEEWSLSGIYVSRGRIFLVSPLPHRGWYRVWTKSESKTFHNTFHKQRGPRKTTQPGVLPVTWNNLAPAFNWLYKYLDFTGNPFQASKLLKTLQPVLLFTALLLFIFLWDSTRAAFHDSDLMMLL